MRTFIENYLHFMKNCIRPHYEKLKSLKSGFIENSNFENIRDLCLQALLVFQPAGIAIASSFSFVIHYFVQCLAHITLDPIWNYTIWNYFNVNPVLVLDL